jgi:hypothetical protein
MEGVLVLTSSRLRYDLPMPRLTLLESTVGFVLLIAGSYAFLLGLWFLGTRFVPAWPFFSTVRQTDHDRSKDRGNPASLLNEYLKRRQLRHPVGALPVASRSFFPNRNAQSVGRRFADKACFAQSNVKHAYPRQHQSFSKASHNVAVLSQAGGVPVIIHHKRSADYFVVVTRKGP